MVERTRTRPGRLVAAVVALTFLAVGLPAVVAPPAEAATLQIGPITAQLRDHGGEANNNGPRGDCIHYSPGSGIGATTTSSAFVGASGTTEARTSHGTYGVRDRRRTTYVCPDQLDTDKQSAVGFKPAPVVTAQDGETFLIGRLTHYNNPITAPSKHFTGELRVQLGGLTPLTPTTFPWELWETPNLRPGEYRNCAFTGNDAPNDRGCADEIKFSNQIASQVYDQDGFEYKLVVTGFVPTDGACPATPSGSAQNRFLTRESATSSACLYASLVQLRALTVIKRTVVPDGVTITPPAFGFTGTSSLDGSPWATRKFSLDPTDPGNAETDQLLRGESVSITEEQPSGDQWSVTGMECLDSAGGAVPEARYDIGAGRITLEDVGPPPTTDALGIVCTVTNTYVPKATLTLVKQVDGGPAQASDFTLSARGPASIGGPGGSAAVTSQRVPAGTYQLTETGPDGYASGPWQCVGAADGDGTSVTVADGQDVTCTVTNTFATATFTVTKQVDGPAGGYTGDGSTAFTGTYTCGSDAPQPFSVSTGTPFVSPPLPVGTSCTVTEDLPDGDLANASYEWLAPVYSTAGGRVTVPDSGTSTVAIVNTYRQRTGSIALSKAVEARPGTPSTGYTAAAGRAFPVDYTCTLDNTAVASGTVDLTAGATTTVNDLPAGATCSLAEATVTSTPGDFADTSYAWDGSAWSPAATVTVPDGGSPASATVTNYFARQTGDLVLSKAVNGAGFTGGVGFTVDYDCGAGFAGSETLTNGATATITGVPIGTRCEVIERAPQGGLETGFVWGAPTYDGVLGGGVAIVPPADSANVAIGNPTEQLYRPLTVRKSVQPADLAASGLLGSATFSITVACDAPTQGGGSTYTQTFSVTAGGSATTPPLPVGSTCNVSELAPDGSELVDASYSWAGTPAPQDVIVGTTNDPVTVTNTIQREYGSLALAKVVEGTGGADGSGTTFTGTWSCAYGSTMLDGTWSVTGPGNAALTGPADQLPLGSRCTITEDPIGTEPIPDEPSLVWGGTTLPPPITLTADDRDVTGTVTNRVVEVDGDLVIGKVVVGGAAGDAYVDADFSFDFSCTPAGGGVAVEGTITLSDGESDHTAPADPIPVGSTCTVVETGVPAALDPYAWTGTVQLDVTGEATVLERTDTSVTFTTPVPNKRVVVRATNTLVERFAEVAVSKAVTGIDPADVDPGVEFPLSLVCTDATYGPAYTGVGGTVRFQVPVGQECRAVEGAIDPGLGLPDASYSWGTPVAAPAGTVEVADESGQYAFTMTNPAERVTTDIGLVKVVDESAVGANVVNLPLTYTGTWTCTHDGDPDVTGTWSVDDGGSATLTGPADQVLLASTCTATEQTPGAPSSDPSYSWAAPQLTPVTVTAAGPNTLTATNAVVRDTGVLRAAKTVTGEVDGYVGTGPQFPVDYACSFAGNTGGEIVGSAQVPTDGNPVVLADAVPLGWTCQVSEGRLPEGLLRDASYAWGTPTVLPSEVTVQSVGQELDVAVTNPVERRTGRFAITKRILHGDPVLPGSTFTGGYECVYAQGEPFEEAFTGTWSVTGAGQATLSPDPELPIGTVCSATEDTPDASSTLLPGFDWTTPDVTDPVTVAGGSAPPAIGVTNTPRQVSGALRLIKEYVGVDGALVPGTTVTGTWECIDPQGVEHDGTWELPTSGGEVQLFGITDPDGAPVGSECTVAEDTLVDGDLADPSFTWEQPSYSPGVTLAAGEEETLGVVNSVSRVFTPIEITKSIDAPDGLAIEPGQTFGGNYTCRFGDDGPATTGHWEVTGTGTYEVPGILVGSRCTVTEDQPTTAPTLIDPSYVWGEPSVAALGTVTRPTAGPNRVSVTNTVERVLTGFDIAKSLRAPDGALPEGTAYDVSWSCTAGDGERFGGDARIRAGATSRTPMTIPIGSRCTVIEGALPDPAGVTVWRPVSFAVAGIAAGSGVDAVDQMVSFSLPVPLADHRQVDVDVTVRNRAVRGPGSYTFAKTADAPSGSTVRPGQVITYTVTVRGNGGRGVPGVEVVDALQRVTRHATLVPGSLTASQGSATLRPDGTLRWVVGTVSGTGAITLTYAVRVDDDAAGVTLRNAITVSGDVPPACATVDASARAVAASRAAVRAAATCVTTTTHHVPPTTTTGTPPDQGVPPINDVPPLAHTGVSPVLFALLVAGLLLIALGALLVVRHRRGRAAGPQA
ncbi:DUF5979 domain-containing protein [Isoptericola aurantiacus]|uniref:DUF5979 domain-containing protein n=1 Tax=Isoptericola aurantiacus TaxID=3377839 RepID=UPI003839F196